MLAVTSNSVSSQYAYVVPRFLILSALMIETIRSSETSGFTKVTGRHIAEDSSFFIVTDMKTSNLT
jgi:hypothetical protein